MGVLHALMGLILLLGVNAPLQALVLDGGGKALIPSLAFLADPVGRLDVRAAETARRDGRFTPLVGDSSPNFGYIDGPIWLHSTLDNHTAQRAWLLELAFATLDEVELYLLDGRSGALLHHYRSGDRLPFAERPLPHRHFLFPLTLAPQQKYQLFLRIRSEGSLTVPLRLWQPADFELASRNAYMAIALYFGVLAALFAYNLLLFLTLRDKVYLYYVAFVGALAVGLGSWSGLFYEYLWPASPVWGNLAAVVGFNLAGMFGAIFSRTFLNSRVHAPLLDRLMYLCGIAFGMLALGSTLVPYQLIAVLTSLVAIIFSLLAVLSGVVCLRRGQHSARYFLIAWSMLLIGTAALAARNLDLLPTTFVTQYAMQIGSALEMLLLSFALAERIIEMRLRKEAAEAAVVETRLEMVAKLQHTEQELEQRVEERTRELSEINRHLRRREDTLKGMALRDPLTGLANRILLGQHMEEAFERTDRSGMKSALLMIDLDHFKPINDQYGHEVGDQLLRAAAGRLQQRVRSTDTVARIGGDEFVILLRGLQDSHVAVRLGEEVVQDLALPIEVSGLTLQVSVSVGLAFYPDHGADAATLLRSADKAMYEAKRSGRNRLCLAPTAE